MVCARGTVNILLDVDLSWRQRSSETRWLLSARYFSAGPDCVWWTRQEILNYIYQFTVPFSIYTNKTARKHYRASVHHCLQEKAPRYLVDCGTPVSESLAIDYYGQPVDTKSAALPVEHVQAPGLFSPWSYFVELFTRSSPWHWVLTVFKETT